MASSLRHLVRRERGQSVTELAMTAGFLCLMLLAVWQVGTVFANFIDLSEATRSGARAGALSGAPSTTGDTVSLTNAQTQGRAAALNSASVPGMAGTISGSGTRRARHAGRASA